jgi:hypothetical protein
MREYLKILSQINWFLSVLTGEKLNQLFLNRHQEFIAS